MGYKIPCLSGTSRRLLIDHVSGLRFCSAPANQTCKGPPAD